MTDRCVTIGSCRKQREARKGLPLCITVGVLAQHSTRTPRGAIGAPFAAFISPPVAHKTMMIMVVVAAIFLQVGTLWGIWFGSRFF